MKTLQIISNTIDSTSNKKYSNATVNSIELKNNIVASLLKRNIELPINIFSEVVPDYVYEYQTFFILKKENEYILMDGFRRLLLNNPPNRDIHVRIYEYTDFTDVELIRMMVQLNHHKFYNNNIQYFDNGFSCFLQILYNINLKSFKKLFRYFIESDEHILNYKSSSLPTGSTSINKVVKNLLNDNIISDLKFLEEVNKSDLELPYLFGSLYRKTIREKGIYITAKDFLNKVENYIDYLNPLFKRLETNRNTNETANNILEIYTHVFSILSGVEVTKTYEEKVDETKAIKKELVKKKNGFYALTGKKSGDYNLEKDIVENVDNYIFKLVIEPQRKGISTLVDLYGEVDIDNSNISILDKRENMRIESILNIKQNNLQVFHTYTYGSYTNINKRYGCVIVDVDDKNVELCCTLYIKKK